MKDVFFNNWVVLIVSLLFLGCNPIPAKSITKALSPEELFEIFEKDTSFESIYNFLESANKLVLNTDVKKAEHLGFTYRDFHEFFLLAN
ncbi:MAG: hypothetical protein HWE07_05045 [Cytophagia bacterium]|nr:hypothetical protein [Cytophagia bacterium]